MREIRPHPTIWIRATDASIEVMGKLCLRSSGERHVWWLSVGLATRQNFLTDNNPSGYIMINELELDAYIAHLQTPPPLEWHLWIIYPPYLTKRRLRVTGRCRDLMIGEHQHIHYMHRKRKVQWNHHKLFLKSHVRPHLPPPLMRHPPPDMIALEDVNHTMQSKVSAIYDSAQQTVTQGLYSSKNHKDITAWSQRDYFCGCN